MSNADLASRANALRALHAGTKMLVLPNAWDAASARAVEAAGFPAIATTSAGVAVALGYEDHQKAPVSEMLAAAARISRVVSVPVTVDFEGGYGMSPPEVVERLIEAGASGYNFEDTDHTGNAGLLPAEQQAERIAWLKQESRSTGVDLVLNARVDVFVQRQGTLEEQAEEGLRRARLYKDAGADCVYPILLGDEGIISRFVEAVGTINVNLRPGGPLSLKRASELGVRRVSYAGSIFRAAITGTESLAAELFKESQAL
jgi:2-methylisocitrate lyase-like PEP mutase family enzyme